MRFLGIRTIAAFLIAPWATILLFLLRAAGNSPQTTGVWLEFAAASAGTLQLATFTYPALLLGIPIWCLFRRRGIRSWVLYALAGGVIGIAYLFLLLGPSLPALAVGFLSGMASGALFRAVYGTREGPMRFLDIRTIAAFLIAPWATMIPLLMLSEVMSPPPTTGVWSTGGSRWAFQGALLTYSALLPCVPVWFLFQWKGIRSWVWYGLAGGLIGIAYMFLLSYIFPLSRSGFAVPDLPGELAFAFFCGIASTTLFRAVDSPSLWK